jgi:hypothetical protein
MQHGEVMLYNNEHPRRSLDPQTGLHVLDHEATAEADDDFWLSSRNGSTPIYGFIVDRPLNKKHFSTMPQIKLIPTNWWFKPLSLLVGNVVTRTVKGLLARAKDRPDIQNQIVHLINANIIGGKRASKRKRVKKTRRKRGYGTRRRR